MSYEITNLGEYINVQGGYAFKSKDFSNDGNPVLKIKNVRFGHIDFTDCGFVSDLVINGLERFKTNSGDILISMTGSGPNAPQSLVGRVAKVYQDDKAAYINQRVGRIQIKDNKVDPDFIFYLLQQKSSINYLVANSTGSANQANINAATICSVPCPKVTFEESVAIADILRNIDLGIRNNSQMNTTLEKIAQRIFKSWFVNFDPVKANEEGLPFDGLSPEIQALFPNELEESEMGMIPKGWTASNIGKEFDVVMGQSPPGSSYNETGEGTLFFQGRRDFGFRYPAERVFTNAPKRLAKAGDTLLSVRAPVGDVNKALKDCCVGRGVGALRHKSGCESFTYYASKRLRNIFDSFDGEGTVFGSINQTELKALKIIAPSSNVMKKFNEIATPLDERIKVNTEQINSLTKIRDKLLPRLISGKITIQKAEELLEEAS